MTKKNALLIIIGALILAILIGATILIKTMFGEQEKKNPTVDKNVTPSYDRDGTEIYSVNSFVYEGLTIKNSNSEYTIRKKDSTYFFEGKENVPLLPATAKALFECVLSLKNESTVTMNAERMSDYGLESPQATITVLKNKGENDVLLLGDKTPDGGGYYLCKNGEKAVYVVSTYFGDRVLKTRTDFYVTDLSINFDTANLQRLEISRTSGFDLLLRYGTDAELASGKYESTMLLEKPFAVGANNDNARAAVSDISHLEAVKVICDEITDENLEKFGFKDPVKVVVEANVDISQSSAGDYLNDIYDQTVTSEKLVRVSSTYYIGSTDGRDTYVMYGDRKVVYAVDKDVFAFLDKDIDYYCQSLVSIKYLKDLKEINISFDGKTYTVKTWTETDSNKNTIYKASYQNAPREGTDIQALYKLIVGVVQYGLAESPGTDPLLKITLKGNNGSTQLIEFLPYEGGLYAFCRTDGNGTFRVLTSQLDKIKEATLQFVNGKTVTIE
ncbi:MAG: hypothetical protein DBX47_03120 [Clostridiales bacterium]|nr:MAG: hypothetical protein DBX47_03120 [Clostridiales bacterium]